MKKGKIIGIIICLVPLGGFLAYGEFFATFLPDKTMEEKVRECISNKAKGGCNADTWNPTEDKTLFSRGLKRGSNAILGYVAMHTNGIQIEDMNFDGSGQRKAESYAWKLYGDYWKGNSNDIAVNPKAMPGSPVVVDTERTMIMRREKPYNKKYSNGLTYQIPYEEVYCKKGSEPYSESGNRYHPPYDYISCKANAIVIDLAGKSWMKNIDKAFCMHTGWRWIVIGKEPPAPAETSYWVERPIKPGESRKLPCLAATYFGKI